MIKYTIYYKPNTSDTYAAYGMSSTTTLWHKKENIPSSAAERGSDWSSPAPPRSSPFPSSAALAEATPCRHDQRVLQLAIIGNIIYQHIGYKHMCAAPKGETTAKKP